MPVAYTSKLATWLEKLELFFDGALRRDAPIQMSESSRRWLAFNLWWVSLALGSLQLCAAWLLWRDATRIEQLFESSSNISIYELSPAISYTGPIFYCSIGLIVLDSILLLAAYRGLRIFEKQGWNMLFYAMLLNIFAGFVMLFSDYSAGLQDFLRPLLLSIAGAYFLFQIREYFTGIKDATKPVTVEKTSVKTAV
jgi:hypothetical protein